MADNLNKLATLGTVKDLAERTKNTFRTADQVEQAITGKGYQTAAQVEQTISGKGYQTGQQVEAAINAKVSTVYKYGGTKASSELTDALLVAENEGMVYNMSESFTATASFVDGAGKKYPAGSNVAVAKVGDTYKFDVLAGIVDLSGLANKVGSATNGHLAALDGDGNLTDSGKSATDFVGSVTSGSKSGTIKVDGVDVPVCEIASDSEAEAVLDEVFK